MRPAANRRGFTLIELLVVIVILAILAILVLMVFRTGAGSDKMRSGARIVQSAFMGAKDRALHAKDLRGIRFIRDPNSPLVNKQPTLCTGFVYLQPIPNLQYPPGSFQLERHQQNPIAATQIQTGPADSPDITILHGFGVDWDTKAQFFAVPGRIRIPQGTGQWYSFTWNSDPLYPLKNGSEYLILSTPFVNTSGAVAFNAPVAYDQTSGFSSCEIQLGNEVLPFHQPVSLPAGVVIDLQYSSQNVQNAAGFSTNPAPVPPQNMDLMFSARGMISGPSGAQGPIHLFLRDVQDATAGVNPYAVGSPTSSNPDLSKGDRLIVTLFPQTGLVQTFEMDATDANGDGIADQPFNFSMQGKSAGR